jgi:hypothetical protein
MSAIVNRVRKWTASYRMLRYRHGFNFRDTVRCALWLARG